MKEQAAISTLTNLGYTYHGAELWKPPVVEMPDFGLVDMQRAEIEKLKQQRDELLYAIKHLRKNASRDGESFVMALYVADLVIANAEK